MATDLTVIAALGDDTGFRARVRAAGHERGRQLCAGDPPEAWDTDAVNRRSLYRLLVTNPDRYLPALALAAAAHEAIPNPAADATGSSTLPPVTDAQIRTAVTAVWDGVAASA